ncbi:MAG: HAD family hydrolase [Christensenellales bacterium]
MKTNIDTIFFDVGATLRVVVPDKAFSAAAEDEIMRLVQAREGRQAFLEKLEGNWKAFRKRAKTLMLDVSEMELWIQHLLPDYPQEILAPNAARLTRLWRDHDGRRVPRPDVTDTVKKLCGRGYKLGIIANTITETEIPDWMCQEAIAGCFRTVILSSKVRMRKPDPAIYHLAARCIGSAPAACAYVGDNPVRDVEGTVASGFGAMILLDVPDASDKDKPAPCLPDWTIKNISDLLALFPQRDSGLPQEAPC